MPLPVSEFFSSRQRRAESRARTDAGIAQSIQGAITGLGMLDALKQRTDKEAKDAVEAKRKADLEGASEARTLERMGWERAEQPDLAAKRKADLDRGVAEASNLVADRATDADDRGLKQGREALTPFVAGLRATSPEFPIGHSIGDMVKRAGDNPMLRSIGDVEVRAENDRQQAEKDSDNAGRDASKAAFDLRVKGQRDDRSLGLARLAADIKDREADRLLRSSRAEKKTAPPKWFAAEFNDHNQALARLDNVARQKQDLDTDRFSAARNWLAQKLNLDDPRVSAQKAVIVANLSQYIHDMTGAAMGVTEAERLISSMPTFGDADATFNAILSAVREDVARKRAVLVDSADQLQYDISGIRPAPDAVSPLSTTDKIDADLEEGLSQK